MKKYIPLFTLISLVSVVNFQTYGQLFTATYDFSSVTNSSGKTDPTSPPLDEGIVFESFQASSDVSANSTAGNRFSFTRWELGAEHGKDLFIGGINLAKYYEVKLTPLTNYIIDLDSISFTLQRSGTGIRQYSVRAGTDNFAANLPAKIYPSSSNLEVVDDNVFQVKDATTSANNGSKIVLAASEFKAIATPLTLRFYGFNAESSGGTFSIDNVTFYGSSGISPTAPDIELSRGSLTFPGTDIHSEKAVLSYTLKGVNLTDPINISVNAPFSLAESETGPYTPSISLSPAEAAADKTIFVQFAPTAIGTFSEVLIHTSKGAVQRNISLSGDGIDPLQLSFDFNDCTPLEVPGSGFMAYSVSGDQKWTCTAFGYENTGGVNISGFAGGAQENEDWLISPAINFSTISLPVLRFKSRGEFSGNPLQLLISTNYDGTGNPNDFTWTNLKADFPMLNNTWKTTDGIDLSDYKSFTFVYFAFKYTSSPAAGASRWTVDDVSITNRTLLLTVNPSMLDFDEIVSGTTSAPVPVKVQAAGYEEINVAAPSGFEVSLDGSLFSNSISISETEALAGKTIYMRFAPLTRQLKIEGKVEFTGSGLDSLPLMLVGSSYPKFETFDAGTYNLSFFGSTPENNPTQAKIDLQVSNIAGVLNKIKLDVVGFEEMSNDEALDSLLVKLSNHKSITSPRWSYSFEAPDPSFPPQKIGFIYDSLTMTLVASRALFEDLYDKARTTDTSLIPSYPTGNAASFWASGRLPFLATFDVNIQGTTKRIHMIDIHGKSASDKASFERRKYDMQVLKDTLDAYFANENVIIVGDYNDRAYQSIYPGSNISSFQALVDDAKYDVLTFPLDIAGRISFLNGSGLIDHLTITDDLVPFYIPNSTEIQDPGSYISNYNATTASDHLPVFARFDFTSVLPVDLISFTAELKDQVVEVKWILVNEQNSSYFEVERSLDASHFTPLARVESVGGAGGNAFYVMLDSMPGKGLNYYRLKQVDKDGKVQYSLTVAVNTGNRVASKISLYPNPVKDFMTLNIPKSEKYYSGSIFTLEGKVMFHIKGNPHHLNQEINRNIYKLKPGMYVLRLDNGVARFSIRFVKE